MSKELADLRPSVRTQVIGLCTAGAQHLFGAAGQVCATAVSYTGSVLRPLCKAIRTDSKKCPGCTAAAGVTREGLLITIDPKKQRRHAAVISSASKSSAANSSPRTTGAKARPGSAAHPLPNNSTDKPTLIPDSTLTNNASMNPNLHVPRDRSRPRDEPPGLRPVSLQLERILRLPLRLQLRKRYSPPPAAAPADNNISDAPRNLRLRPRASAHRGRGRVRPLGEDGEGYVHVRGGKPRGGRRSRGGSSSHEAEEAAGGRRRRQSAPDAHGDRVRVADSDALLGEDRGTS